MTTIKEFCENAIRAMNDLMGEATGHGVVQDWANVNDTLVTLERLAKSNLGLHEVEF